MNENVMKVIKRVSKGVALAAGTAVAIGVAQKASREAVTDVTEGLGQGYNLTKTAVKGIKEKIKG
jgi:polysaccharide deacetylase 2 family uncharacterized protein YibQ